MVLHLEEQVEFEALPERVWGLVGDFAALDRWTIGTKVLGVTGQGVGAVRVVSSGRHELVERLERLDPVAMVLEYRVLGGPLKAHDYVSSLSVALAGPGRSRVRWSATCTPAGVDPGKLELGLRTAYRQNLLNLAASLAGTEGGTISGRAVRAD